MEVVGAGDDAQFAAAVDCLNNQLEDIGLQLGQEEEEEFDCHFEPHELSSHNAAVAGATELSPKFAGVCAGLLRAIGVHDARYAAITGVDLSSLEQVGFVS
jgi:hypothetical protein